MLSCLLLLFCYSLKWEKGRNGDTAPNVLGRHELTQRESDGKVEEGGMTVMRRLLVFCTHKTPCIVHKQGYNSQRNWVQCEDEMSGLKTKQERTLLVIFPREGVDNRPGCVRQGLFGTTIAVCKVFLF